MKIRSYLVYALFFMLASTRLFAGENVIGWTISPIGGFPSTQVGNTYGVTYTLSNNHPVVPFLLQTSESLSGPFFSVVDNCNGVTLAPKGQANNTCTIVITYAPTEVNEGSVQVEVAYGHNRVLLPKLAVSTPFQSVTGARLIGYLPGYSPPASAQALSNAGYTHIIVAFGVFSTTTPGKITSAFGTVSPMLIKQMQQLGIKVLLSLGGASSSVPNTTVNFHQVLTAAASPAAFQATFLASLTSLVAQYGFDGFDFDIEEGLAPAGGGTMSNPGGDIAALANIINAAHAAHPTWLISLAPQTVNISANSAFNGTFANYSSLVMQTHAALTWVGIQIYNSGTIYGIDHVIYDPSNPNTPNASVALAVDLLANWPQGAPGSFQPYMSFLNPSQVVLGYLAPNSAGQVDGGSPRIPLATIKRAVQCLRTGTAGTSSCGTYVPPQSYPTIGGVFGWQTNYDQNNNFGFAIGLKPCVIGGNCG